MDFPPEAQKVLPGAIGAISALALLRDQWKLGLVMVLPGVALSYYASEAVAKSLGLPEGLSGFLLGLCGMSVVARLFDTWNKLDLGTLVKAALRKWLGLKDEEKQL